MIRTLTGEQLRAGRALGRLDQADLARRSGLSLATIQALEAVRGPLELSQAALHPLERAFADVGVRFEDPPAAAPGHAPAPAAPTTGRTDRGRRAI